MIAFRCECALISAVSRDRDKLMGTLVIANIGNANGDLCDYEYRISKFNNPNSIWKKGIIKQFDRVKRGPWDLAQLALNHALGNSRNENQVEDKN